MCIGRCYNDDDDNDWFLLLRLTCTLNNGPYKTIKFLFITLSREENFRVPCFVRRKETITKLIKPSISKIRPQNHPKAKRKTRGVAETAIVGGICDLVLINWLRGTRGVHVPSMVNGHVPGTKRTQTAIWTIEKMDRRPLFWIYKELRCNAFSPLFRTEKNWHLTTHSVQTLVGSHDSLVVWFKVSKIKSQRFEYGWNLWVLSNACGCI